MKVNNINEIYEMLSWKNPLEIQEQGYRLAQNISDLSLLICPPAEPSVWEHCARILSEKSDDHLTPYLKALLEWLYDLNWPGALTILNRLKTFSGEKLRDPFIKCISYATHLNNAEGNQWIGYLSELLDNEELKLELPQEILEILQKSYPYYSNN